MPIVSVVKKIEFDSSISNQTYSNGWRGKVHRRDQAKGRGPFSAAPLFALGSAPARVVVPRPVSVRRTARRRPSDALPTATWRPTASDPLRTSLWRSPSLAGTCMRGTWRPSVIVSVGPDAGGEEEGPDSQKNKRKKKKRKKGKKS